MRRLCFVWNQWGDGVVEEETGDYYYYTPRYDPGILYTIRTPIRNSQALVTADPAFGGPGTPRHILDCRTDRHTDAGRVTHGGLWLTG